jgi:formimidoylglutamate deiminase
MLALDGEHPDLEGLEGDAILDSFAFAGDGGMVTDVWAAGRHVERERIVAAYRGAVRELRAAL